MSKNEIITFCEGVEVRRPCTQMEEHLLKRVEELSKEGIVLYANEDDLFELKTHQCQQVTLRRREYKKEGDIEVSIKYKPVRLC